MNSISKTAVSSVKSIGVRSFATGVSWTDMCKSKTNFVHFVNEAVNNPDGPEASEMYKFLTKCFVDNDSDYDGLVSYKGFNNMIQQAALAPRRFGFAPHTRELYESLEEFSTEREGLFKTLDTGGVGRITLESWLAWANAHIVQKAAGLEVHSGTRWERSVEDFTSFFQGVSKESSSHCTKSSTSTQYKEFYIMANNDFVACDANGDGLLDEASFNQLLRISRSYCNRFAGDWYANTKFADLAEGGKVSWLTWFEHNLAVVKANA